MLSFIRMLRGTFHMMLFRLNASSHAIVIDDVRPSPPPAVWSVRRPPPNRNTGKNILAHRRARHNRDPLLERIVERLELRPELPTASSNAARSFPSTSARTAVRAPAP